MNECRRTVGYEPEASLCEIPEIADIGGEEVRIVTERGKVALDWHATPRKALADGEELPFSFTINH